MAVRVIEAIDANIFVSVINKERDSTQSKKVLDLVDDGNVKAIPSTIVIAEMCSGYANVGRSNEKNEFLTHVLGSSNYEIAEATVPVALNAGNLRAMEELKLPDALVVASGLPHKAEFLISNGEALRRRRQVTDIRILSAAEFAKEIESRNKNSKEEN